MSTDSIVVTGATGNIGSKLVRDLLAAGKKVRAVARTKEKLQALKGVEVFAADLSDEAALTKAFAGAKAVFAMIPPKYDAPDFRAYQNEISKSLVSAVASSGVKHVVNLSSVGADLGKGAGVVDGLYDNEQRFNGLKNVNILHLRPTFFLENLFFYIPVIKGMGVNGAAFKPDVRIAMVATQDIAAEAAARLKALDFNGHTVKDLLGQREVSMAEATKIIGSAIQKPDLKYVQFSYDDTNKALLGMGMSPDAAKGMVELYRGTNDGVVKSTQGRSAVTSSQTSIEEFVRNVFVPAYGKN